MNEASQTLLGTHDFASFQSSGSERASTVRTVSDVFVERREEEAGANIVFEIEANGFLYNMVRAIVGTLVEIGRGAESPEWIKGVLSATNRKTAGMTAPPHGLFYHRDPRKNQEPRPQAAGPTTGATRSTRPGKVSPE